MKLNRIPNMTLYLVLTDLDIFKSIMEVGYLGLFWDIFYLFVKSIKNCLVILK